MKLSLAVVAALLGFTQGSMQLLDTKLSAQTCSKKADEYEKLCGSKLEEATHLDQ